jgi:sugar transferase (PEP-CTERM/EpsH1 system associated)
MRFPRSLFRIAFSFRMRIGHVVFSLKIGGQERLILNLSRELEARGHEVMVICLTEGGALRREFGSIPIVDIHRRGGFEPSLFPRLARCFLELRPNVIHTHNPGPLMYAAPAARAALVRRVVHTKHGANAVYTRRSLAFARAAVRTLSAFVPVSEETAEVARALERVPERLLHVIPNGIPLAQFNADPDVRARVRDTLGIDREAIVIGSVGRLVVEKDYPLLVRAVAPMLGPRLRLVLVGEGPARGEIEEEVARTVPETARTFVTLTGARHDVPALMAGFDIFALSSKTEGLPLVVPEAMASSLPVVATAVGGVPSVVPGSVGMLVPHGDSAAFRAALEALAANAEERRAKARAARAYAHARFSIETMTTAYENLYQGASI